MGYKEKILLYNMSMYILASGSPRRKEILTQVGISFKVKISECEEVTTKTRPDEIVMELATIKNNDVTRQVLSNIMEYDDDEIVIISADTMVFYHEHMLGKPKDVLDAKRMLEIDRKSVV